MKLDIGSILNMTPETGGWEFVFDLGDAETVVCPVIGWATVVTAHLNDGTVHTEIKPAFVWGDLVWTEPELHEHAAGVTGITLRHPRIPATAGIFAS
ncbi:hypothetical protein ACIQVK_21390 [Streptomyces sp. NPDC090493]|uniref:hypothetical protein n=1 Tax=Streptomyces sp. NPDC090493 TaxID=3365964 RepID=UPI003828D202